MTEQLLMIFFIAVGSMAAYHLKALTFSGAAMAFVVGFAVFCGFGRNGFILLATFFITSTLWSQYKRTKKAAIDDKLAKGATRDWRQVLANGGTAAFLGFIHYFSHHSLWILAFAVAIASANSDTWASEIGSLSKKNPIDIRTFRRVEKGTSGAVSLLGSFAALSGAFLIALISCLLFHLNFTFTLLIFIVGFIGNIVDTLLGAFYQQKFICQCCGMETEKIVHCDKPTIRIKGFTIVDNDMVNFLSGFIAVLIAITLSKL